MSGLEIGLSISLVQFLIQLIDYGEPSMKKFALLALISTTLSGCIALKPYEPTPLNENAKGITTVRSTPYGCKVLGEVEGKETWDRKDSFLGENEEVIDGAMNDLRNKAFDVVGGSKRITLRVIQEKTICNGDQLCDAETTTQRIKSHKVYAQIFECGDKK